MPVTLRMPVMDLALKLLRENESLSLDQLEGRVGETIYNLDSRDLKKAIDSLDSRGLVKAYFRNPEDYAPGVLIKPEDVVYRITSAGKSTTLPQDLTVASSRNGRSYMTPV